MKILNKDLTNISTSNKLSILKKKKNITRKTSLKNIKKVVYEEELDSEPELEEEDYVAEETKEEPEIKKKV